MATTIRGNMVGKEKRGTFPSSSLTKKSPKPSSQNHPSAPSISALEKPIPNYLKSKVGSTTTKRITTDIAEKPPPIRRRSFDRPHPVSQVQRAIHSGPGTRVVKQSRSASFSHRPGSSSALVSDRTYARTTSSLKEAKIDSSLSKSHTRKKSTMSPITPVIKKGMNGLRSPSSIKKAPNSVSSDSCMDHHDNPTIHQLSLEEDDLVSIDIEVQSLPEMSEMPDSNQELGDPITFIDTDLKLFQDLQNNFTISDENYLMVQQVHTIEKQHPTIEQQNMPIKQIHLTIEEHSPIDDERNMTLIEQPSTGEEQSLKLEEQNPTAKEQNFKEESDEGDKVAKNIEHKVAELVEEEQYEKEEPPVKDENLNVKTQVPEPFKAQSIPEKKDKQAYNDVIEQTASKLMGGKKNKVLALAGAFETVISLQDTTTK